MYNYIFEEEALSCLAISNYMLFIMIDIEDKLLLQYINLFLVISLHIHNRFLFNNLI
jgi:hypothetical protein